MKCFRAAAWTRILNLIALAALIGFTFAACSNGTTGNGGGDTHNAKTYTYTGTVDGVMYTLKIDGCTCAGLTPKIGDNYTLTVGGKTSTGAVTSFKLWVLTLEPFNATITFTVTVSGISITAMSGTITWSDDTTATAPTGPWGSGPVHTHQGGAWQSNAAQHWRVCTICGDEYGRANHTFTSSTCTVCGYSSGGTNPVSVELVWVPGGSFQMGNPDSSEDNRELPVHTVTLTGFYIGKYEVTQAQYKAVMGNNPSIFDGVGDNYPVYYVNWHETLVFCNKLSISEGLTPAYRISNSTDPNAWGSVPTGSSSPNIAAWNAAQVVSGSTGYRLPTEAQWEYAAKGGDGSPGNYTYSGSNNPDEVAWYEDNSGGKTHEVGTKAPNGLGLYDMNGNVDEWCWDWYGSYSGEAQTDPMGASSGDYRVLRGGWFDQRVEYIRSTWRSDYYPSSGHVTTGFGFRIVRP